MLVDCIQVLTLAIHILTTQGSYPFQQQYPDLANGDKNRITMEKNLALGFASGYRKK
jgi:hypothetical protein